MCSGNRENFPDGQPAPPAGGRLTSSSQLSRRRLLTFGTIQLGGLSTPGLHGSPVLASPVRRPHAKACILLFMDGGPSHIDLWDMKPEAPSEIRGPFQPMATSAAGVQICEHLPRMARLMHRVALVRSVCHEETVHDPAVYQTLTGRKHLSSGGDLKVDPADAPQIGTLFGRVDRQPAVMPKVVELPETMKMGARILPGQNAGFLGPIHDPYRVSVTPEAQVIRPELEPQPSLTGSRLDRRARLLGRLNDRVSTLDAHASAGYLDSFQQQALGMLARPEIRTAFDVDREPEPLRDRYGRHRHGQSVLLARRLVEAGARFVTVYWGKEKQDWADGRGPQLANNPWDTHRNHFPLIRDELIPRADQTLSALLEDLHTRGLLDETLIVWMGEFGRTPWISDFASRDHWPHANSLLFAGAGVPGGLVYGRTDRFAAEVTENPVSPADITATILHALGVDPAETVTDTAGRQHQLSDGSPVRALLP